MMPPRAYSFCTITTSFLLVCGCFLAGRNGATGVARAEDNPNAAKEDTLPKVVLRKAPLIQMPGVPVPERSLDHEADSNNPLHWDGDTLYLFNNESHPWRSSGPDIEHLGGRFSVDLGAQNNKLNIWIESTWKDDDGTLYGAYHYEPDTICFSNSTS